MIASLLMMMSLATAQRTTATAPAEPTVVFVCEHGAAKSVIATTYFNKIAKERGLRARADFRGVNPQADLSVSALRGLRDDGLAVPDRKPSPISQTDVDAATVIFANSGRYFDNGSVSEKRPSSYSIMAATPVTALVIEYIRTIVSGL